MLRHRALVIGAFTPVAGAVISEWVAAGHEVAAFWHRRLKFPGPRNRDRRLGRLVPRWSVAALSRRHGFPIVEVPRLATWTGAKIAAEQTSADVLISVYFPNIVPPDLLAHFSGRAVNFHPAMLPRYRGPSPIVAMVLDRTIETEGAMTLHVMSAGLDEGDIITQSPVAFPADRNLAAFNLGLAMAAGRITAEHLPRYLAGALRSVPQNSERATYPRVTRRDLQLSARQTADEIRWRCDTLAVQKPLRIDGLEAPRVTGFGRVLGPPSGQLPRVGLFTIDFDAADARIRVVGKRPFLGPWRRLREFALYIAAPAT